ncbi:MAG: ABC transporter permease [Caulobacteraceae bacterium]
MNALHLLWRYLGVSVRAQLQYPVSAVMLNVAQFFITIIDVLAIAALFARFGRVQGWRFGEVVFFYGVVSLGFAIADFLTRGFDVFGTEFVRTGAFDRLLLRPRSLALQLVGHDFRLSRFGRAAQAVAALVIATYALHFDWTAGRLALTAWAVAGGAGLFCGLFVLQATLAFWTVESLEVANVLTYGGVQAAQFPLTIYAAWFRDFLIFVVPLGCVAYYPVVAILGRTDPLGAPAWFLPLAPAAGFAFLGASFIAWRFGVRRYTSTGS